MHLSRLRPVLAGSFLLLATSALGQTSLVSTKDILHGYAGVLEGASVFTPSGHTGQPGDYAIDFTTTGGGVWMPGTNSSFLNIVGTNDIMSFSFWSRQYFISSSSVFWVSSPLVTSGGGRAFAANCPWSNDSIYFDTAGCCDGTLQRINASITTFAGYSGDDSWWTNWHHFVFLKNGPDKQIWIDGQLFLDGSNTSPLPTGMTNLWLGNDVGDGLLQYGQIDDFAVYATALSSTNITLLANGTSPTNLAGEKIIAYWPFDDAPPIGAPSGTPLGFSFTLNDVGSSVLNTNTLQISLNGTNVVASALTKTGTTATVTYRLPNPPFAPGSTQYTTISIKDQHGNPFSADGSFVVEQFGILTADMALPAASVNTNNSGFKILTFQVDNAATGNGVQVAEDILAGVYGTNVADFTAAGGVDSKGYFTWPGTINFNIDQTLTNGYFPSEANSPFPGIPGNTVNVGNTTHFACDLYAALKFTTPGLYTMAVASDDDFGTFTGPNPYDYFGAQLLGEFNASGGRGVAESAFQFYVQQPGFYGFRTVYEQGGGGAVLQWYMINPDGTRVLLNDTNSALKAYQWLPTITAAYVKSVTPAAHATGTDPGGAIMAVIVDGANAVSTNTVGLKLDGTTVPAQVTKASGVTTVLYTPSPILAPLSVHQATVAFKDGANQVSEPWPFTVEPYSGTTKDQLHGYAGIIEGAAVFTPNGQGHTGKPGDYAMDFGAAAGGDIHIENAGAFINVAATNDIMSFSIWLKRYGISQNSSLFWADSPSSMSGTTADQRGWQAHVPWSNDNIYFDTAGCCDGTLQRISAAISTFSPYTGNDGWWTNWHHFVFLKNGPDKQIWIDGQLFLDGSSTAPLPTDYTDLYLGANSAISVAQGDGALNTQGAIDDFAVYSTALSAANIALLASGTSPTNLTGETLLAYWNFNDAPPAAPTITISSAAGGASVTLTFSGTLQSAPTVMGPWTSLTNASPSTLPVSTAPRTFYRSRQ